MIYITELLIIPFVIGITVAGIIHYLFPIITVCGNSMYPTYHDREIIIGTRIFRKSKLKRGDVVMYYSPYDEKRIVIKRIDEVRKGAGVMYCLGDNSEDSYDSKQYGYIALSNAVCKPIRQRKKQEVR